MSRRDDTTLLRDMIEAANSAISAIEETEPAALAADCAARVCDGPHHGLRCLGSRPVLGGTSWYTLVTARVAVFGAWPGFVDAQRPPIHLIALQRIDGGLRLRVIRHFNKPEAAGTLRLPICDDADRIHRPVFFKDSPNAFFGCSVR